MALKKNQFQTDSVDSNIIENLTIVDSDVSPTAQIQQVKIEGLTNLLAGKANKIGDTLTGTLILPTPTLPASLVNKKYIDDNLPTGATTVDIKPDWHIVSNTVVLSPHYIINDLAQIQSSNTSLVVPFNATTIENNVAIANTFYYLYATGTNFIFSTQVPNAFSVHPSNPEWTYLGSLRTNASAVLLPYRKCENHYYYRASIFSGSGNNALGTVNLYSSLMPPTTRIARISVFHSFAGTTTAQMILRNDPTTSFATFDFRTQTGSRGQTGFSYNNPKVYVPVNSSGNFYYTYTGIGSYSGFFLGYVE